MDEAGFAIIPFEPTPSAQSQSGSQGQSTQDQSKAQDQSETRAKDGTPEDIDDLNERLKILRWRLAELRKQKDFFGAHAAPHIQMEIEDICRKIRDIKQQLRDLGETVEDKPIDNCDLPSGGATGTADAFLLVEEKYIEKTSEVYVAPANYLHAQRALKDNHVVVLCGKAEMGTRMSGVRLLRDLQIVDIHQWDPSTEISLLQALGAQSQAHLIHQMKIDAQAHLGKYELQQLSSQLRRQRSYLVITIDETSPLVMQLINDYAILWDKEPSDLQLLVKKHLLWYTSELHAEDRVQELCDRVAPLLRKRNWPPGRLASLAAQLVQTDGNEAKIQEVVGDFERDAKEQLAAWFATHPELESCALMMALAVFGGAKSPDILKTAQSLFLHIKPTASADEFRAAPLLNGSRRQWLTHCSARVAEDQEPTPFGDCRIERLKFDDLTYSQMVLEYIWREHPHFHQPILDWLRELMAHTDGTMRQQAAYAAGKLSAYDFDEVYHSLLLPYAKEAKSFTPITIANALSVLITDDYYRSHPLRILNHWSTRAHDHSLQWVAAVIYGQYIGVLFPDEALKNLQAIVQNANQRVASAVRTSLADLFYFGWMRDKFYESILTVLLEWTSKPNDTALNQQGLRAFLKLTEYGYIRDNGEAWPRLLWLYYALPAQRSTIATLWRRTLNCQKTRARALDKLYRWIHNADQQAHIYPTVEQLIRDLAAETAREHARLCFYLHQWASNFRDKSASAEKILVAIRSPTLEKEVGQ